MYDRSARLYDKLYHFKDYETHTSKLFAILEAARPNAETLLEVACGTGRFLELLGRRYRVEGLDISPQFLEIAGGRIDASRLHLGDMVSFDLGKRYDIVACLFSSIAYVHTRENFFKAISALAKHVAEGGLLVIEPFFTEESYWVNRVTMNTLDEPDFKLSWMYVSEKADGAARLKIEYLVGEPGGVEHFSEVHDLGLFSEDDYRNAFEAIGYEFSHDPVGIAGRGLYVARAAGR